MCTGHVVLSNLYGKAAVQRGNLWGAEELLSWARSEDSDNSKPVADFGDRSHSSSVSGAFKVGLRRRDRLGDYSGRLQHQ